MLEGTIIWAGVLAIVAFLLGRPMLRAIVSLKKIETGEDAYKAWETIFYFGGVVASPIAAFIHPFLGLVAFALIYIALPFLFPPKGEQAYEEETRPTATEARKPVPGPIPIPPKAETKLKPKKEEDKSAEESVEKSAKKKGFSFPFFGAKNKKKREKGAKESTLKIEPIIAPETEGAPPPSAPKPAKNTEKEQFYKVLESLESKLATQVPISASEPARAEEKKKQKKKEELGDLAALLSEEGETLTGTENSEEDLDELEELEKLLEG